MNFHFVRNIPSEVFLTVVRRHRRFMGAWMLISQFHPLSNFFIAVQEIKSPLLTAAFISTAKIRTRV